MVQPIPEGGDQDALIAHGDGASRAALGAGAVVLDALASLPGGPAPMLLAALGWEGLEFPAAHALAEARSVDIIEVLVSPVGGGGDLHLNPLSCSPLPSISNLQEVWEVVKP